MNDPIADATTSTEPTRRALLAGAGSLVAGVALAGCSAGSNRKGWTAVDSPVSGALFDAVRAAGGPVAVGESGRVVARRDGWRVVAEGGPAGRENDLTAAAATADGRRVWFAGSSGAVGAYDRRDDAVIDRSAPRGKTSTWEDVAVVGPAGRELLYLANGSGELLPGTVRNDRVRWGDVTKPGDGTNANAIVFGRRGGYVGAGDGSVYASLDDAGWHRVGIDGEGATVRDLAMLDARTVDAVTDDGGILHYDGFRWLSLATSEAALHAIDRTPARGLAVGPGGTVYGLAGTEWTKDETPTDATLHGVALGGPDVAVGDSGTILERVT